MGIDQAIGIGVDAGADHLGAALEISHLRRIAAGLLLALYALGQALVLQPCGVVAAMEDQRPDVPEIGFPADFMTTAVQLLDPVDVLAKIAAIANEQCGDALDGVRNTSRSSRVPSVSSAQ